METLKLKSSIITNVLLLIVSLIFGIGGFLIMETGDGFDNFIAIVCIVFTGLGVLVAILQMLPNSSYLLLTPQGLTIRQMFREFHYSWQTIKEFKVGSIFPAPQKMVIFDFKETYKEQVI